MLIFAQSVVIQIKQLYRLLLYFYIGSKNYIILSHGLLIITIVNLFYVSMILVKYFLNLH